MMYDIYQKRKKRIRGYCRITKPNDDLRLILEAFGIDSNLRLTHELCGR
jgi:hypothetical protein